MSKTVKAFLIFLALILAYNMYQSSGRPRNNTQAPGATDVPDAVFKQEQTRMSASQCDGVARRVSMNKGDFLRAVSGCHAEFIITPDSPGDGVTAMSESGPLLPVICKANQYNIQLAGEAIGWKANDTIVLQVTYTDL